MSGEPDDNPERATLNRFLLGIGPVASVPIKPTRQIARVLPTTPHPSPRSPSLRCAYALIASASATGIRLVSGSSVPRTFSYQSVEAVIENGVARDIVKAGMASLIPATRSLDERFSLSATQVLLLERLYGRTGLVERGLLRERSRTGSIRVLVPAVYIKSMALLVSTHRRALSIVPVGCLTDLRSPFVRRHRIVRICHLPTVRRKPSISIRLKTDFWLSVRPTQSTGTRLEFDESDRAMAIALPKIQYYVTMDLSGCDLFRYSAYAEHQYFRTRGSAIGAGSAPKA